MARKKKNSNGSMSMAEQEQAVLEVGGVLPEQNGPALVVNGRMLAEYVKPYFSRDKNDDRFVGLEFAVKLTDAHQVVLPPKVMSAWEFLRTGGQTAVEGIEVDPQTVRIYATSDVAEEEVLLVGAVVTRAKVAVIEERGNGEAVKFTRYSFRLLEPRGKNILHFACWNDGKAFWVDSKPTQASML